MKKQLLSNLKQPITSGIGVIIMGITLIGIFHGDISWQWDGAVGVVIGLFFFSVPDQIVPLATKIVKKLISKDNGSNPNTDLQ